MKKDAWKNKVMKMATYENKIKKNVYWNGDKEKVLHNVYGKTDSYIECSQREHW